MNAIICTPEELERLREKYAWRPDPPKPKPLVLVPKRPYVRRAITTAEARALSRNANRTITDDQVLEIRLRASRQESFGFIAAEMGISRNIVAKAAKGITFKHLPGAVTGRHRPAKEKPRWAGRVTGNAVRRVTEEQVQAITTQLAKGKRIVDVAAAVGLGTTTVKRYAKWAHVK